MAQKQYLIEYLSSGQISQRNTNFQVLWVKKKIYADLSFRI